MSPILRAALAAILLTALAPTGSRAAAPGDQPMVAPIPAPAEPLELPGAKPGAPPAAPHAAPATPPAASAAPPLALPLDVSPIFLPPAAPQPALPNRAAPVKSLRAVPVDASKPAALSASGPAAPISPPPPVSFSGAPGASGALATLSLPSLALPEPGIVAIAAGLDYWRGGHFLFTAATTQRTGLALSASAGLFPWLEAFGGISFRSANLFSSSAPHQTLGSYGDSDLGLKLVLPRTGPLQAGLMAQLDLPAGVGGFTMKGAGGRVRALVGLAGRAWSVPLAVSLTAGYRIDNSGKLVAGSIATFPAFALGLAAYDQVEGGLSFQVPLWFGAPTVEVVLEAPVARGKPLPAGGYPVRARALAGLTRLRTPVPDVTASLGAQFSLVRTGRPEPESLPMPGLAPDAPWTALASLSWSFEPRLPERKELQWHEPEARPISRPPEAPAASTRASAPIVAALPAGPPVPAARSRMLVSVIDGVTNKPVPQAWINAQETGGAASDKTADETGMASFEIAPGAVMLNVTKDGYESAELVFTAVAGQEKPAKVILQPIAADAFVRGKLTGEDGEVLRATVACQSVAGDVTGFGEAEVQDGTFQIGLPHGLWKVSITAPGFRAEPFQVELRPSETVTRDVTLRRIAGEPVARLGPKGVEISRRFPFASGFAVLMPSAGALTTEVAALLATPGMPQLVLGMRVEPGDLVSPLDAVEAQRLSDERAAALLEALIAKGAPRGLVTARGLGLAIPGQPLLELRRAGLPGSSRRFDHFDSNVDNSFDNDPPGAPSPPAATAQLPGGTP